MARRSLMPLTQTERAFPCPVYREPLDVRESKRSKPYVVCDSCGVQMFVRNQRGIRAFSKQVQRASLKDVWETYAEMERRYRKRCPDCGHRFWVESELIHTSWINGEFEGYRCPQEGCKGIVKEETEK